MNKPSVDDAFVAYFEDAKAFLILAQCREKEGNGRSVDAFCRASLLVGFASLEAFLCSVATDFIDSRHPDLSVHDLGFLSEKEVNVDVNGAFAISDRTKFSRLEDRILFVYRRFSGTKFDRTKSFWSTLQSGIKLRNEVVHPKNYQSLSPQMVAQSITAVLEVMNYISIGVYKRKLPLASRRLSARLDL
jgi:hypothetical protein